MTLKNIPIWFLLVISVAASFLLGCGGGGSAPGGGATTGGSNSGTTTPTYAPTSLTTSSVFVFTGAYRQAINTNTYYFGTVKTTLTVSTPTTGAFNTVVDVSNFYSNPASTLSYTRSSGSNTATIVASVYDYGAYSLPASTAATILLQFTSASGGNYSISAPSYADTGTFTAVLAP